MRDLLYLQKKLSYNIFQRAACLIIVLFGILLFSPLPVNAVSVASYIDLSPHGLPVPNNIDPSIVTIQPSVSNSQSTQFYIGYTTAGALTPGTGKIVLTLPVEFTSVTNCDVTTKDADNDGTQEGGLSGFDSITLIPGLKWLLTYNIESTGINAGRGVELCFRATTPLSFGNYSVSVSDNGSPVAASAGLIYIDSGDGFDNEVNIAASFGRIYYSIVVDPEVSEVGFEKAFDIRIFYDVTGDGIENISSRLVLTNISTGSVYYSYSQNTDSDGSAVFSLAISEAGEYSIVVEDLSGGTIYPYSTYTTYWQAVAAPIIGSLPAYTNSSNATVSWTHQEFPGSTYEYYLEIATDELFTNIVANSGWITDMTYYFGDLPDSVQYYFRVKARNTYLVESDWSGTVSTTYDKTPPTIIVNDTQVVVGIDDFTFTVDIDAIISDNVGISTITIYCIDGTEKYECGEIVSNDGSSYVLLINSESLRLDNVLEFFSAYEFCISATDLAGNTYEQCGLSFSPPSGILGPIITIPTILGNLANSIFRALDSFFKNLEEDQLLVGSSLLTSSAIAISLGAISIGIMKLPMMLFQFFSNLLSLLGLRARGKPYGFIYNSVSKEPIPQAVVRAYEYETSKLVRTDVSDVYGVFSFKLPKGKYKILVSVANYIYPSKVILGKTDFPWENVYHGEIIEVKEETEPNLAIPVDPVEVEKSSLFRVKMRVLWGLLLKILSPLVTVVGFIVCFYLYRKYPNTWNFIMLILYIPIFILSIRSFFIKPVRYGHIKDKTGRKVESFEVGLRETDFGRILNKRVTDTNGLYRFIVPPGDYELVSLKDDYVFSSISAGGTKVLKPRRKKRQPVVIARDLRVEKKQ